MYAPISARYRSDIAAIVRRVRDIAAVAAVVRGVHYRHRRHVRWCDITIVTAIRRRAQYRRCRLPSDRALTPIPSRCHFYPVQTVGIQTGVNPIFSSNASLVDTPPTSTTSIPLVVQPIADAVDVQIGGAGGTPPVMTFNFYRLPNSRRP